MNDVIFIDNYFAVKEALKKYEEKFLTESAKAIESQVKENTSVDSSNTKQNWKCVVDISKHEAIVGNPLENAVWEEFGTGEYALYKKSSGWWVYVKDEKSAEYEPKPKRYTEARAKQIVAILRKKELEAYCTKGKRPRRALHKAFETKKSAIIRRARQLAKEELE